MATQLINRDKSIIPSLDFTSLDKLREIVQATADLEGIGGYKIGFELGLTHGIPAVVQAIKEHSSLPIIYDHQKAGTDIPAQGKRFMDTCKDVDSVIVFPQAGPVTEKEWIKAAQDADMHVMIGGEMTHEGYLEETGGFINNEAPKTIYQLAVECGVTDFVVPGNKPERIAQYLKLLQDAGCDPTLYSPGIGTQGGDVNASSQAGGKRWHAFVGRALYQADDIKAVAQSLIEQL